MKEKLIELLEYNHHFNKELTHLLSENLENLTERLLKLMNHILNAQQIWNARINSEVEFGAWQMHDFETLQKINSENYQNSIQILNEFSLEKVIFYTNSKGENFSNTIADILFHVINHSTYHRAQIASEIKSIGIEPINTDYIFFKRKENFL